MACGDLSIPLLCRSRGTSLCVQNPSAGRFHDLRTLFGLRLSPFFPSNHFPRYGDYALTRTLLYSRFIQMDAFEHAVSGLTSLP